MEIATRGAIRAQLTKLSKAAIELLSAETSQLKKENAEHFLSLEEEFTSYIERLSAVQASIKAADKRIEEKGLVKEDFEKECEKIAEYDDQAVATLARLRQRLLKIQQFSAIETNNSSTNPQHPPLERTNTMLQKLPLKKFDGNVKEWIPFWDQFNVAVHENQQLSAADKFHYLDSVLCGGAKKAISGFTASAACYDAAVALLKEQFGDTERLVDEHIQQLVSLRPVQLRADVHGLRQLYNSVTTCRRSLTSLQVPAHYYDVMLKSILLRCLPTELRIDYHRTREREVPINVKNETQNQSTRDEDDDMSTTTMSISTQMGNIMEFLKREIEALERSKLTSVQGNTKSPTTTAASLVTLNDKQDGECVFCRSSSHRTSECNANMTTAQKRDVLLKSGRCFRCARKGHCSKKCRSAKWIRCNKCKGNHLTAMCDPAFNKGVNAKPKSSVTATTERKEDKDKSNMALNLCNTCTYSNVYLKTARCICRGQQKTVLLRAVIDGGSQNSYVCEDIVDKLGLVDIGSVNMAVIPFGTSETAPVQMLRKVKIPLQSQYDKQNIQIEALVVPKICVDVLNAPDGSCVSFSNLRLADQNHVVSIGIEDGLKVLIGADFYWDVVTGKQLKITKRLRAVETLFGWTIQGQHDHPNAERTVNGFTSFVSHVLSVEDTVSDNFTNMWTLDAIGIRGEEDEKISLTKEMTQKCIRKVGSRYEASLPWKDPDLILESNRRQAVSRLKSLIRQLSRDPVKLKEYDEAMRQLIKDRIAEPVGPDRRATEKRIFYLPHRPVYKEDSTTTKLRIVFDASASSDDVPSLNNQLFTGTNLLPEILMMLLNFRLGRIGVVADIEKAFLQIFLNENDRDSHRFIWVSTIDEINDNLALREFRMTRVTFGNKSSPFILSATIQEHLKTQECKFPETCKILRSSFYMDDFVASVDTDDEAIRIYHESVKIMKDASMNLRKWHSNSAKVRNAVNSEDFPTVQKVLGLSWLAFSDELAVPLESVQRFLESCKSGGSKRNALQAIARIYDPLGIVCPTVIKLKILFQKAWKRNLMWDEILPPELLLDWNDCVRNILQLKNMAIPRSALSFPISNSIECHIFADASTKAYGAVAYVRDVDSSGVGAVSFLCAKCRVAPLKLDGSDELTLPKLELTAALIAARMCAYFRRSLKIPIKEFFLWTDSKITLHWILGQMQRWKPYVQSRVVEIRLHTPVSSWYHCSGKDNPADLITRGVTGDKLRTSLLWAHGPDWLKDFNVNALTDRQRVPDLCFQATLLVEIIPKKDEPILCCENVGSWTRMLRVTGWVFRFLRRCRHRIKPPADYLTKAEIEDAERYWIRYLQLFSFTDDLHNLQKDKPLSASSKVRDLSPFLDEKGLMRIRGRLQMLDEPYDLRHPILLPVGHHIAYLITQDRHLLTIHGGVNRILTKLREHFWIIKGRNLAKRVVKDCTVCKKLFGRPASQPFAPLPLQRITLTRPFDNVGIDFAGPLYYANTGENIMHKAYILLFTCAAVRAVHLELTTSLSTESCLMALRRFMARRGIPSAIFSDNAKTFRRASLELSKLEGIFEGEAIQSFLTKQRVQWNFIVERAPWWGGFWERLIRTVKNSLKVSIGKARLNFEQLRSVLAEAEATVNERPLTYVSAEPIDLTPLTPAKFLLGWSQSSSTIGSEGNAVNDSTMRELWKDRMKFTTKLAKRWRLEYLQLLRSFHYSDRKASIHLKEGDVVLLFDQAAPRIHWKMVIIEKAFLGRDGKVRSCEIRCADGSTFRRPVQLLYPLELPTIPPGGGC